MDRQNDFSQGSIARNILSLAIPMTLAQLINVMYSIVDRIYIGHLPDASAEALTGIGLALPVITIITAFSNLFGMGGAPLCSIARGAHEDEKAQRVMGNSMTMLMITGILLMLVFYLFKKPMLYLLGASEATFAYADDYLTIYLAGTLFVMLSLGMNNFINSQGFGRMGMLTVLLGAVVNLVLDPVFIFVFKMGVRGAALATVISQGLSAFWVLRFLTGRKALLRLTAGSMRLSAGLVREILILGTSGFVMSVTNGLVQMVCNVSLQRYGGDIYVGIMTVINSVREIITMPVSGLTSGAQPVIGYNYGAGCYKRVKASIKFISVGCLAFTAVVWAALFLKPEIFLGMFTDEPEIIKYGVPAMRIYFCGIFMMALQFAGQSASVALNRAKQAVFFSIFRKVLIVVPLTLILPAAAGLGSDVWFWAEPISNLLGGSACFITMLLTIWPQLGEKQARKAAEQ